MGRGSPTDRQNHRGVDQTTRGQNNQNDCTFKRLDRAELQRQALSKPEYKDYKHEAAAKLADFLRRSEYTAVARPERDREGRNQTGYYAVLKNGREIKVAAKQGIRTTAYDGTNAGGDGVAIGERRLLTSGSMEAADLLLKKLAVQSKHNEQAKSLPSQRAAHSTEHASRREIIVRRPESWFIKEGGKRIEVRAAIPLTARHEEEKQNRNHATKSNKEDRSTPSKDEVNEAKSGRSRVSIKSIPPPSKSLAPEGPSSESAPVSTPKPPEPTLTNPSSDSTKMGKTSIGAEQSAQPIITSPSSATASNDRVDDLSASKQTDREHQEFLQRVEAFKKERKPKIDMAPVPPIAEFLMGTARDQNAPPSLLGRIKSLLKGNND